MAGQQHVIDYRNVENPAELQIDIVPPALRQFGFIPNFGLCRPGDLILSRGIKFNFLERSISRAQERAGFAEEHSQWTHAAVFLYDTLVAEAVPKDGVRVHSLYNDTLQCVMRVRRPRLNGEARVHLALRAVATLGSRYGTIAAFQLGHQMLHGLWNPGTLIAYGRKVICSKVYFDAHIEIAKLPLSGCPMNGLVGPAHLSATDDLDDVLIPWVKPI
jgi:hypothetical protein